MASGWFAAASGLVLGSLVAQICVAQLAIAQTSAPAAQPAVAAPPAVSIVAPADPVAHAAFDMLEKHCARCHQDGRLTERLKPARNFGNVLKLDELALNPNFVKPGNPDASLLFNVIAEQKMPYDVFMDFVDPTPPAPSQAELQALRTWIEALGRNAVASCDTRKFVTNKDTVALVAADLQTLPERRQPGTRYLDFATLYNACVGDADLDGYRQGAVKLLNSLSQRSDVVRLEPANLQKTLLRFNLEDLGWSAGDWNTVLGLYPYGSRPDAPLFGFVGQATGTPMPYLRADWFTFAAAQPPLYNTLLKLPNTFDGLQRQLAVDVVSDINKFLVERAGFQHSGVSANNRLIERHAINTGYLWTSYDFSGSRERQSLFKFPLGPGGEFGFRHDGGETIFSLPNGFQGYYLSNAKGDELATGPTQIVRDPSRRDLAVTNGISCFGCHDQGIRKAKDDVREQVLADREFPKRVRDAVDQLYPPAAKLDTTLEDDAKRFRGAMVRAGLDPSLKVHGVEMINALSTKYEETLDLRTAAAEFGLKPDEMKSAASGAGAKAVALVRRLDQGLVPRDQFETDFATLVTALNDEEALDFKPGAASIAAPRVESGAAGLARSFDLSLTADRPVYNQGDNPVLTVLTRRTCNLTLIDIDSSGSGTIIFPNQLQPNGRIEAGREFRFGDASTPFKFRLADRGTETVIAECNATRRAARGFEPDFKAAGFTDLGNYAQRLTRQIVVEGADRTAAARRITVEAQAGNAAAIAAARPVTGVPSKVGSPAATAPVQPDVAARTSVKLEVR